MSKLLIIGILLQLSVVTWAKDSSPKYQRGDCITPVASTYSWHGKYATVEAFTSIDGLTKEKSYILAFPFSGSSSTIFDKEIEAATKKISQSLCGN